MRVHCSEINLMKALFSFRYIAIGKALKNLIYRK
jgi:hypothetical protein